MSMDAFLAEYYGTKTASAEDVEKQAQVELFAKLAAHNGIDLEQLSPEQVQYLWDHTFAKTAEKDDDDDDDEEKVDEAKKEYEEKKEAMAKIAEADFLGRVMAHSMVRELRELGGIDKEAASMRDSGKKALEGLKGMADRGRELLTGSRAEKLKQIADTAIRSAREAEQRGKFMRKKRWELIAGQTIPELKKETKRVRNARIALGAAGAAGTAALGGGAYAAYRHNKEKKSSALDELAAESAVVKAAEAGWDLDEASERIAAVLTLGAGESEKIAHATDLESAVDVRSLELLEAAGYPVTWE